MGERHKNQPYPVITAPDCDKPRVHVDNMVQARFLQKYKAMAARSQPDGATRTQKMASPMLVKSQGENLHVLAPCMPSSCCPLQSRLLDGTYRLRLRRPSIYCRASIPMPSANCAGPHLLLGWLPPNSRPNSARGARVAGAM